MLGSHPKKCDCATCAKDRALLFQSRLKEPSLPNAPGHIDQTVFVRPHFRRQANHFNKMPNSRSALRDIVRALLRKSGASI